jgi:hypothetical protein
MKKDILNGHASNERGEGKLSSLIWLAVLAAILFAAWNVAPVYISNYSLKDKMNEIARLPRGTNSDQKILDLIMKQGVNEFGLQMYLRPDSFKISTYDGGRTISCAYDREAEILPGWKKTFHFENQVDQPLVY